MREWIIEGFAYEFWANREWAVALAPLDSEENIQKLYRPAPWPDFPVDDLRERAVDVFLHLIFAQRLWLERCGRSLVLSGGPKEWTQAISDGWIAATEGRESNERIDYRNGAGEAQHMTLGEIVRHVLRHGAYHRG